MFCEGKGLNFRVLLLGLTAAVILPACENTQFSKYNPFRHYSAPSGEYMGHSGMRVDNAPVTPMPPMPSGAPSMATSVYQPSSSLGNSSVEVFSLSQNAPSTSNASSMPQYGSGAIYSGDPSVTIYPLDGSGFASGGQGFGTNAGFAAPQNTGGNQIFFKHGSSRLGGGDRRTLSSVAEQAKFAPVNRVTVAGYASPPTQAGSGTVESHILNLKESMNRSFAVSKQLMQNGVPAEKIKTVSWGATKSTGNNTQDRRVDVVMGEQ